MKRPAAHDTDASLTKRNAGNIVLLAEARASGGPTEIAGSALELTALGLATEQATPARADMLDVAEAPAVMPVLSDLAIRAIEKVAHRNIITSVQALGHYPKRLNSYAVAQATGAVLSEHKLAIKLKNTRKTIPVRVVNFLDAMQCSSQRLRLRHLPGSPAPAAPARLPKNLEHDAARAAKSQAAKDMVARVRALGRLPRLVNRSRSRQLEQSRLEEDQLARSMKRMFTKLPEAVLMYLEKLAQDAACDLLRQLRDRMFSHGFPQHASSAHKTRALLNLGSAEAHRGAVSQYLVSESRLFQSVQNLLHDNMFATSVAEQCREIVVLRGQHHAAVVNQVVTFCRHYGSEPMLPPRAHFLEDLVVEEVSTALRYAAVKSKLTVDEKARIMQARMGAGQRPSESGAGTSSAVC